MATKEEIFFFLLHLSLSYIYLNNLTRARFIGAFNSSHIKKIVACCLSLSHTHTHVSHFPYTISIHVSAAHGTLKIYVCYTNKLSN